MATRLAVAEATQAQLLVDGQGDPVWPIASKANELALQLIAAVCGGELTPVRAVPGEAAAECDEEVVALGGLAEAAGLLCSHLTRRHFRCVEDFARLSGGARPALLVTTWDCLSVELLDWLYNISGPAPGIICSLSAEALQQQVVLRTAAAQLCGPLLDSVSEVFPLLALPRLKGEGVEVVGSAASRDERRRALQRGAGVLTIMTHSDGVDAFLGGDLTLCSRIHEPPDIQSVAPPRCAITGECHRHGRSVELALASDDLIAPEDISARVLLFDACFGVMPSGSLVDPVFGIGPRLAANAGIGAFLAPWRFVLSSPEHVRRLERDLLSGRDIGSAVGGFNALPTSRDRHYRMCIFGDPRMRLPKVADAPEGGFDELPSSARGDNQSTGLEAVQFLRLCMAEARARGGDGGRGEAAGLALAAVEDLERWTARGLPVDSRDSDTCLQMRQAVLDYALLRGKLNECWFPFVREYKAGPTVACPACGRRADTQVAIMRLSVVPRRMVLCPICGMVEDSPMTVELSMELFGRSVGLGGELPTANWCAGVALTPPDPAGAICLPWPTGDDGSPARWRDLPELVPAGPFRISIVLLWGTDFAVLSRLTRG